jgi:hypothetical protein
VPGRQGNRAMRESNPACGSAGLPWDLPPRHSPPFLPVVSRRKPRELFTCRGRLQDLGVTKNQYGGPGQVQRLDTSYAPQKG